MEKGKHFVLVHGACFGAWSWFKIVPLLKSAGQRVTALDLGGCGVNTKRSEEVNSIGDYLEPLMELMESLPENEKVILVGHAYGGISISLAMERFPEKVLVAVHVTAFMPKYDSSLVELFDELFKEWPLESLSENPDFRGPIPGNPFITPILHGPKFLSTRICHKCQPEDLELVKMSIRPSGVFLNDLSSPSLLTKENYGSVKKIYIGSEDDQAFKKTYGEWMIQNSHAHDVKFIAGADHMPMLSKPRELFLCFQEIAAKYD